MAPTYKDRTEIRPRYRAGFEFNEIPLEEAVTLLRSFALAAIDRLLGKKVQDPGFYLNQLRSFQKTNYPGFPGLESRRKYRALGTYTRQTKYSRRIKARWHRLIHDRRVIAWQTIQLKLSDLRARGDERLIRLAGRHPGYYRRVVRYSLGSPISNRARRLLMLERLARRFFGPGSFVLPDDLWCLAGELAWKDLRFCHHVARDIRLYLRDRMVFEAGSIPNIQLSPRTFWLLLALYQPPETSWWRQMLPSHRRQKTTLKQMRRVAQREAYGECWAKVWDQWLILESLLNNETGLQQLNPKLRKAVVQMPLLSKTTKWQNQAAATDESVFQFAKTHWGLEHMKWLKPLYESSMWEVTPRV